MPSIKTLLFCGLVKPSSNKPKESRECKESAEPKSSSSDDTSTPSPPPAAAPLGPRPSRRLRRNAWVYFRRPSQSSRHSGAKFFSSSSDTASFTAPPPLRRAAPLKDLPSPTGNWSSYKTAQELTIRDEEERELRDAQKRERLAKEREEREQQVDWRARRRIEGQRESREVEEWFKKLMANW
ncbi:uncharacterized protein BKA78DRAFT_354166 [Phyllosticta capitalensis]|uniref:uncharacterized protein n=1 Tax=Phyllosticta capitalensis TaxID=121624 RepID=UPI003130A651